MTMNNTKDASSTVFFATAATTTGPTQHVNTLRVNRLFDANSVAASTANGGSLRALARTTLDKDCNKNAALLNQRNIAKENDVTLNGHCDDGKKDGRDVVIEEEKNCVKPLKGILVHQGCRSQDGTPHNTPRFAQDPVHRHSVPTTANSSTLPSDLISGKLSSHTQKRTTSSSAVADFLKKFSPKLGRSKKSLQWYTVDIRPSAANGDSTQSVSDFEKEDPTLKELQNGRISSEFSNEMVECLLQNKAEPKTPPSSTMPNHFHNLKDSVHLKHHTHRDHADNSKNRARDLPTHKEMPSVVKSVPVTPVVQNHSPWRPVVVDIDIDKPGGKSSSQSLEREAFFQSMKPTGSSAMTALPSSTRTSSSLSHKHVEFRLPDNYFQNLPPYDANSDLNRRVPSYIKLSRALNGYSARNMYTSKKLVNSRDYNMLLCKSEEYLNRRTTPVPTPTLSFSATQENPNKSSGSSFSARSPHSPSSATDFRRAASEDRDLSLVGRENGTDLFKRESSGRSRMKPGHEFLQKLDAEVINLQKLCNQGQQDFAKDLPEEASEQLRSAIGKTNLLLTQKFEQFRQLCQKNISETESDALKTTVSDLQGFWDMMSIQISDVQRMFKEVDRLKARALSSPHKDQHSTPSSNGSDVPPTHPPGTFPDSVMKSPGTPSSGARRQSKPKVTFQLNERDVQRKEMIAAAKRKGIEMKRKDSLENSSNAPLSLGSVAGGDAVDVGGVVADDSDIQIFMPAVSASAT